MAPQATVRWGCQGFHVTGVTVRTFKKVLHAVAEGDHELAGNMGLVVSALTVELRALGFEVRVAVDPGHLLRHKACGRLYRHAEWLALPGMQAPCASFADPSKVGWFESRTCGCTSTISYASIELVHAEDILTAKGGEA